MGVMRFVVPDRNRITDTFLAELYIASFEGVPWRCFAERTEDGFHVRRRVDESGCLYVMWKMADGGELLLSTANLMVREKPYLLPIEIARGTLNRLRNQAAAWQQAGLVITPEVAKQIRTAAESFTKAATSQHDVTVATAAADETIAAALRGSRTLVETYVHQLRGNRKAQPSQPLLLSARLDSPDPLAAAGGDLLSAFNTASVSMNWDQCEPITGDFDFLAVDDVVDWAKGQKLKVMAGPLLSFDSRCLPDWLVLWEDDFQALQSYVVTWVREAVERFRGEMNIWHCAAKLNSGRVLSLTDEQRLKLTVVALETIRQVDPKAPAIISFDQPWAEYMTHTNTDVAPLHYADALARANLGLGGLGLHIDWGYRPGGTLPRNPLELSQLLDTWSLLGLPLVVFLTMPSTLAADPQAAGGVSPLAGTHSPDWNEQMQSELATQLAEICWCKQSVQGVVWNQSFDATKHTLPHAGLFDAKGRAKPLVNSLAQLRKEYIDAS